MSQTYVLFTTLPASDSYMCYKLLSLTLFLIVPTGTVKTARNSVLTLTGYAHMHISGTAKEPEGTYFAIYAK